MALVNAITDKPDWQHKVFDDTIVAKWKAEALVPKPPRGEPGRKERGQSLITRWVPVTRRLSNAKNEDEDRRGGASGSNSTDHPRKVYISPRMVDWAMAEVKYKAEIFNQVDCIEALDGVWKSDTTIDGELRKALEVAVQSLEDVPEEDKDCHPGSNDQVLNLVHLSIYPLVYGQSPILANKTFGLSDCISRIGSGETLQNPDYPPGLGREWSKKFQWLPAEVEILPDGKNIVMKSYINNLHPRYHSDLYSIISKIIAKAIPLWDRVLSRVVSPPIPPRVSDWSNIYMGFDEAMLDKPEQEEGEDDIEFEDCLNEWFDFEAWAENRNVIEPEPGKFQTTAERTASGKIGVQLQRCLD
ncbi:MAG: hypothetical protein Q9200_002041 [Gallowayella weberi]